MMWKLWKDKKISRLTPYSVNSHITECTNSNSVDIIEYGKICKKCQNIKVTNFIAIFGIILVTHTCKTVTRMPQIICKILLHTSEIWGLRSIKCSRGVT